MIVLSPYARRGRSATSSGSSRASCGSSRTTGHWGGSPIETGVPRRCCPRSTSRSRRDRRSRCRYAMTARARSSPRDKARAQPRSGVACRAMEDDRSSTVVPGSEPWEGTTRELAAALRDLVARLREEQGQPLPEEAFLQSPSSIRRRLKTLVFRTTRPATRRYDRLTADLATIAGDLAARLAEAEEVMRKARGDYERLEMELRALAPSERDLGERRLDGDPGRLLLGIRATHARRCGSIVDRLRGYEDLVVPLRDPSARPTTAVAGSISAAVRASSAPCSVSGAGTWRASTRRRTPSSVPGARDRGNARRRPHLSGDAAGRPGPRCQRDPADRASPRRAWVHLFQEIHRALAPGGALLRDDQRSESRGDADYFVADVTHTWPGIRRRCG